MTNVDADRSAQDSRETRALGSLPAPRPERLLQRAEFLRVSKGARFHARAFSLQARPRDGEDGAPDAAPARFGFTVTRKAGGSVERNRMRRRLREALRRVAPLGARAGHDYVIVARREALDADFTELARELSRALRLVGTKPPKARKAGAPPERVQTPGAPDVD
jgi:ribonuclease P protein component